MMSLDNGATDRQSYSHSVGFRRIKSFEEPVRGLRFETDSRIFHAKAYPIPLIPFGSYDQFSRAIVNCFHRVRSVA